jgi:hypothetical protein
MISERGALYYDSADTFPHAYNRTGGAPRQFETGPGAKMWHGPNLDCLS